MIKIKLFYLEQLILLREKLKKKILKEQNEYWKKIQFILIYYFKLISIYVKKIK